MPFDPKTSGQQRRKRVRLRLRPNLAVTAQNEGGQTWYVVKDPVTLAYFRMDEGQRFVAERLDGAHTLEDVRTAYEEAFRPARLPLEELEAFAAQLLDAGLAEVDSPLAAGLLCERARKHRREVLLSRLLNVLYIKVPLCDPDAALGRLAAWVRPLCGPAGLLGGLGAVLAAAALVVTHWGDFLARLPTYREFFTPHTLLYMWLALGLAKVLHELGHGIACKLHGGSVPEMGLLFLVFFPTLYCDASDSWVLPGKWRRMAVAAAGVYVDLLIAAAAALVWWLTRPDSLAHHLAFGLLAVCGVGTVVWNANPLMRFDGYYLLSDWLDVPNLAERSARFLQATTLRWLGADVPAEALPARGRVLFAVYAAASYAYRVLMAAAIAWALYALVRP
jgi:putative peptide zinc metalloprotease protein